MTNIKKIWKSKTFWANTALIVVYAAGKLLGVDALPEDVAVPVAAIVNIILRYVTKKGVSL